MLVSVVLSVVYRPTPNNKLNTVFTHRLPTYHTNSSFFQTQISQSDEIIDYTKNLKRI